ncbi:unnamed protein product, partial [Staurois parvus]
PIIGIPLLTSCQADSSGDIYTDHQGTDAQCPDGQCSPISATCQCTSMPHISADLSHLSVPTISFSQCRLSVPVSDAYQCHI